MNYVIFLNTWVTKGTPWVIQDGKDIDPEILANLREAILKLPTRVSLPKYFSDLSLPRYYQIYFDNNVNIVEIVGVRRDSSPTKWSYRLGYWHPKCQHDIARALSLAISKKVTQEVAP
jgi:hypothetical protein